MEQLTRKYIATIFGALIIICITFIFFFFFGIGLLVTHNSEILNELAMEAAWLQQKRSVENVIIRIENKREEIEKETRDIVRVMADYFSAMDIELFEQQEIGSRLQGISYSSAVHMAVQYWQENDMILQILGTDEPVAQQDEEAMLEQIESSLIHESLEKEEAIVHIYAQEADIDEVVKQQIHDEIHSTVYGEEQYIWVNEVINYEGGDNYAIRAIHPNLVETEGDYLSTSMQDAAGNMPYREELNGIKQDGEIFYQYYFKKMNSDEIAEKLSYAKLYEPYNWIVATGEPIDNVLSVTDRVRDDGRRIGNWLIFICIIIVALVVLWVIRQQRRYRKSIDTYVKKEIELDALTGVLTRKAGQAELEECFADFQRTGNSYMLMIMDVDKFKSINDNHGHAAGDKVLRQVAQVLLAKTREGDFLIRWGGDEFVLLCKGVQESQQPTVANKLLNSIRALQVGTVRKPIPLTLSMGYSGFSQGDKDYQQALARADEALYHSKETGRNKYTGYEQMIREEEKKKARETAENNPE